MVGTPTLSTRQFAYLQLGLRLISMILSLCEKIQALTNPSSISLRLSLVLAALAVLLRPTNVLIWLAIGTLMLTRLTLDGKSPLTRDTLLVLFREIIVCG